MEALCGSDSGSASRPLLHRALSGSAARHCSWNQLGFHFATATALLNLMRVTKPDVLHVTIHGVTAHH